MLHKSVSLSVIASILTETTTLVSSSSSSVHSYGDAVPNSCVGLEDGDYWLQPSVIDESYMPVKLTCSNEYMIVDVSKDSNLMNYFSSFEMWHYRLGGPANHDPVNWQEWFVAENQNPAHADNTQYILSPDCSSCDEDLVRQVHGTDTTYWMTGNLAKLHWPVIGFNECDMDWTTYQCYDCSSCFKVNDGCEPEAYEEDADDFETAGICGVTSQISTQNVYRRREMAQQVGFNRNYKPSIGTDGNFCVCYKPDSELARTYYLSEEQENVIEIAESSLALAAAEASKNIKKDKKTMMETQKTKNEEKTFLDNHKHFESKQSKKIPQHTNSEMKSKIETDYVYLSQNDFEGGTYRIKESGTYVLTEDIIINFNSNDDYWPRSDQIDDYPGAGSYRDAYHLGFFAAITIECDNVVIDLNGFELSQSLEFYYMQRWFAHIELGNQQFLPGQGPAFFGNSPILTENIEIKNGVLGRTSHFAIHGNFPTNLKLTDLVIHGFVTHGIQLNGWTELEMDNIEIGPSSTIEYLMGDYAHGRILQQRISNLQTITEQAIDNNEILDFNGNKNIDDLEKLIQVGDELDLQMELAYNYAINRVNNKFVETDYIDPIYLLTDEDKLRWASAKKQFVHESGFPSSSSITGIFLNFQGASVFSYTMYTTHQSSNGKLNNIYIHDLTHDMVESHRFSYDGESGAVFPTPWLSDIPAQNAVGGKENLLEWYKIVTSYNNGELSKEETLHKLETNDKFTYQGTILSDVYFTIGSVSDDWDELGAIQVRELKYDRDDLFEWVNNDEYNENMLDWRFGCNQDIMSHSGKGLLGLRIDGVDNIELSNIKIERLYQHTPLGSDACSEYLGYTPENDGGHFKQSLPMQHGFSGNDLQAMSIISSTNVEFKNDIIINDLSNDYSQSFGISFWTANDILFNKNSFVKVTNVKSGGDLLNNYEIEKNTKLNYYSLPNRTPESCAVRLEIINTADYYNSNIQFESTQGSSANIITCNVIGREMCLGPNGFESDETNNQNEKDFTMYGNYFNEMDVCNNINSIDDLKNFVKNSKSILKNNKIENNKAAVTVNNTSNTNQSMSVILISCVVVASILLLCLTHLVKKCCYSHKIIEDNSTINQQQSNNNYGSTNQQPLYVF